MTDLPPNITTVVVAILGSAIVTQWLPSLFTWLKEKFTGKKKATLEALQEELQKKNDVIDKIANGIKYTLQDRLQFLCEKYLNEGWIPSDQLKKITNLYSAYHALGGNDFITELFDKTRELPIRKGR